MNPPVVPAGGEARPYCRGAPAVGGGRRRASSPSHLHSGLSNAAVELRGRGTEGSPVPPREAVRHDGRPAAARTRCWTGRPPSSPTAWPADAAPFLFRKRTVLTEPQRPFAVGRPAVRRRSPARELERLLAPWSAQRDAGALSPEGGARQGISLAHPIHLVSPEPEAHVRASSRERRAPLEERVTTTEERRCGGGPAPPSVRVELERVEGPVADEAGAKVGNHARAPIGQESRQGGKAGERTQRGAVKEEAVHAKLPVRSVETAGQGGGLGLWRRRCGRPLRRLSTEARREAKAGAEELAPSEGTGATTLQSLRQAGKPGLVAEMTGGL